MIARKKISKKKKILTEKLRNAIHDKKLECDLSFYAKKDNEQNKQKRHGD